jgi:hypothetical protein
MSEREIKIRAIAALIEIVSLGEWKASEPAARRQAEMYMDGIRDGRIADVTEEAIMVISAIPRE